MQFLRYAFICIIFIFCVRVPFVDDETFTAPRTESTQFRVSARVDRANATRIDRQWWRRVKQRTHTHRMYAGYGLKMRLERVVSKGEHGYT